MTLLDPDDAQRVGWNRQYTDLLDERRRLEHRIEYVDRELDALFDKLAGH